MDDWDTMLELARSRPTGLRELIEKHGATPSHEIAGVLLGVLNQLRREGPMPSDEVNQAIFGLLKTLSVWEIAPWTPEGMLSVLSWAIYENGIPDDADRYALAQLIERAAAQDEKTCSRRRLINDGTIELCGSLAARGELLSVLSLRPGAREFVAHRIEEMKLRFATEDTGWYRGLYDDDIDYVLEVLRGDS
jgi:hypothetical protein